MEDDVEQPGDGRIKIHSRFNLNGSLPQSPQHSAVLHHLFDFRYVSGLMRAIARGG